MSNKRTNMRVVKWMLRMTKRKKIKLKRTTATKMMAKKAKVKEVRTAKWKLTQMIPVGKNLRSHNKQLNRAKKPYVPNLNWRRRSEQRKHR